MWINSGPLLWHQSGNTPYDSLQLTQKELLQACELAGFQLLEEPRVLKNVPYCRCVGLALLKLNHVSRMKHAIFVVHAGTRHR